MVGLDGYLGELAASWRPHIALALAICAALALAVRSRFLAGLLAALAVALGADVIRTGLVSAQATAGGDTSEGDAAVRVVFSNLSVRNDDTGKLVAWLKVSDPDVVVATEVSPRHVAEMARAMVEFPFRVLEPRGHSFGMAVYSRYPISGETVTELVGLTGDTPPARIPIMVSVDVETPAGPLHVAGFHLFPPLTPQRLAWRNEQLAIAGEVLAAVDAPKVVVGDFNATPWSAGLRAFQSENDLTGFNARATWPVWLGFAGIPIDHAFVSRDLQHLQDRNRPRHRLRSPARPHRRSARPCRQARLAPGRRTRFMTPNLLSHFRMLGRYNRLADERLYTSPAGRCRARSMRATLT